MAILGKLSGKQGHRKHGPGKYKPGIEKDDKMQHNSWEENKQKKNELQILTEKMECQFGILYRMLTKMQKSQENIENGMSHLKPKIGKVTEDSKLVDSEYPAPCSDKNDQLQTKTLTNVLIAVKLLPRKQSMNHMKVHSRVPRGDAR